MVGRLRVPAELQRWSAMGYDFATMVHNFNFLVRFLSFCDVSDPHTHRQPPSAAFPYRQPIRCQPSDLVPCCRSPSRYRHSPPRQRTILVARLRLRILLFPPFAVVLLPKGCNFHVRRLSWGLCRYYVSRP